MELLGEAPSPWLPVASPQIRDILVKPIKVEAVTLKWISNLLIEPNMYNSNFRTQESMQDRSEETDNSVKIETVVLVAVGDMVMDLAMR